MKDDKSIHGFIIIFNYSCYVYPVFRIHVGTVNWLLEGCCFNIAVQQFKLRNVIEQFVKIEVAKRSSIKVLDHPDGSTCIYKEYVGFGFHIDIHIKLDEIP